MSTPEEAVAGIEAEARRLTAVPAWPLLTRKDVAARLQVSEFFAGELLRRGAIKATRIGRLVRCTEADLAAFIEARRNIDRACLEAKPLREILAAFPNARLSQSALDRHRRRHLSPLLRQAKDAADAEAGTDVLTSALEKLTAIEGEAKRLAAAAEAKGQYAVAGNLLVTQATRLVELTAGLKGLLQPGGVNVAVAQVNVVADRERALTLLATEIKNMPAELQHQVIAWLRQRRRAILERETAEIKKRLDSKEPPPRFAPAAPSPSGQDTVAIPLLPGCGGAVTTIMPDGGDMQTDLLRRAAQFVWPHLQLTSGRYLDGEAAWHTFALDGTPADVAEALAALTITARGPQDASGPKSAGT